MKNLFAGSNDRITENTQPDTPAAPLADQARLCREAVFDRQNQLSGHLFRLHQSSPLADGQGNSQPAIDRQLLDILGRSPAAWNTQTAFIPLSSTSLTDPAIERLPADQLTLLVRLSLNDDNPGPLQQRLSQLHQRGFGIALFHQPWHPAFKQLRALADFAILDVAASEARDIQDFRALFAMPGKQFLAINIDSPDEQQLCQQSGIDFFHGRFASRLPARPQTSQGDPYKVQLLNLLQLIEGGAATPEIAEAMKQAPVLTFRILRYLNSPAIGLNHPIDSISQALTMLGRQRLSRWLAILLFSVKDAGFADWLLIESALTRGRLMEELGGQLTPKLPADPLFLTGIFSCLDRLLQRALPDIIDELPISDDICHALLVRRGPFAPLLAVAEASEMFDVADMESAARNAGLDAEQVNQALLAATAWASSITGHWE
ncbi:MAG: HDOD domain-containing protein [Azonexus sp.]